MRNIKMQAGDKVVNNQGCKAVIHEYKDCKNVVLVFQDKGNTKITAHAHSIRSGSFYNPMNPTIFGVGYLGIGEHKSSYNGVKNKTYTRWMDMMQRCYSESVHEKFPTYKGCSVDPIWHNFQDFAEWYENHEYFNHGYQLDKDLIELGNKVYSPEFCSLIPRALNMLVSNGGSLRNGLPLGIKRCLRTGSYMAGFSKKGKWINIGSYRTLDQAIQSHHIEKEAYIRELTSKFRGLVDERVYDTLMNWRVTQ